MSVGLDIGSRTIKILETTGSKGKFELKASGVVGYSGKAIQKIEDDKELANLASIISKLHKDANVSERNVNISLAESQVFTRNIKFPLLTDQEIASAVRWEAEQYIPIPLNEAIVQHQILERKEKANPPQVSVLLVASPRKLVEKYIKVLELAKLNVVGAETELIALVRSLAPPDQIAMIIDIGTISTDIAISKNGLLTFSRSFPTAGDALTRAVAQSLGVEYQQAEEYKRTYGFATDKLEGKIASSMRGVFNLIVDEIKKALHFYQTEEGEQPPRSIILTGGSASTSSIVPILSSTLGLEVSVANPFGKISMSPEVAKSIAPYSFLYAVAAGLAMKE